MPEKGRRPSCDNFSMVQIARLFGVIAVTGSLAACSSVASPSTGTTEDFSGTLAPLGQTSKPFSASKNGEVQLTLQSLTPRPVVGFVTIAVGQPVGDGCSPMAGFYVAQAGVGQQYAFPQIAKGSYCTVIADANAALTTAATFSIRLVHP